MTARLTVVYGLDADAYLTARAADKALEGHHVRAMVERTEDWEFAVWLVEMGAPIASGRWFLPGEQLVVTFDDGWRIDPAPAPTVAVKRTPEAWCAEYGIRILDPDDWRSKDAPPWTEPLTLVEFYDRAVQCTASADWTRIANDVKAAAS
jgi:hypothetical protein